MQSVWYIKREYWTNRKKTPTKLPSELIAKILAYSSKPGDVICDPFLGSGQVAKVAKQLRRKYIGFEIEKNYYDFALENIASAAPLVITKGAKRLSGPDPSVADKCIRCGRRKPNKHRNFCSIKCQKLWGKK